MLAFAALLIVVPARAAAPICNELAQSDFAPAPMMPVVLGSIGLSAGCEDVFGFERGQSPQDPQSNVSTDLPHRAVPSPLAWPPPPWERALALPAACSRPRPGFAPGVYRPPWA